MKIMYLFLVSLAVSGFSTFAVADDLNISNDSKWDLSFSINNICSKELGVVNRRSVKVISEANFLKACAYNPNSCKAEVYNRASCRGGKVATVVFDTNYGVQALSPTGITTKGSMFNLFLEGPWQ